MPDIFSAIKPLVLTSTVLGLGPFVVDEESKSLKICGVRAAYTLFILVLFAAFSGTAMYQMISISSQPFTNIGEYTSIVLLSCGIVVGVCSLVLTVVQRKKIAAVVRNFHEVDTQMAKLDVGMPYNHVFRYSLGAIVALFVLISGLFVHDYLVTNLSGIFFWVAYFGPIIFSTLMLCQFISGGLLLKKNFNYLNERLIKFGSEEETDKKIEFIEGYDRYFESHPAGKYEGPIAAWESGLSRSRARKIFPRGLVTPHLSHLTKIKIIRKIHSNLCEIKELLNSSYSLQLLVTVAQAFVIITTNLYSLFTKGGGRGEQIHSISFPIIWVLFRSMELICVTVTCTRISKSANYTAVVVHRLLSQDWESNVRNQLKLFSIQLLHRKISFSACGFFTLDMTLLHAIIGAATTYLVILVQFHNTYEHV